MITIIHKGIHCTIQDLGRVGFQKYGVISSGAMDTFALRVANLLVGNKENEACLEILFGKTAIRFHDERIIAITGGNLMPQLNGKTIPVFRPILVKNGDVLQFQLPIEGFRAYVAISGGLLVEAILGSKSTNEIAHFGGFEGRALCGGDQLKFGKQTTNHLKMMDHLKASNGKARWRVQYEPIYATGKVLEIKVLPGLDQHLFKPDHLQKFEQLTYTISNEANRIGYRLEHDESIELIQQQDLLSEAVTYGTIQIPPSGRPIILMADAQTIGGYPKIGQVLRTELPKLAQAKPGQQLKFQFTTLEEAEKSDLEREFYIKQIKHGILSQLR